MTHKSMLLHGCYKLANQDGARYFNAKNQLHREDGPAVEDYVTGYKEYWLYGQRVKLVDLPAFTLEDL